MMEVREHGQQDAPSFGYAYLILSFFEIGVNYFNLPSAAHAPVIDTFWRNSDQVVRSAIRGGCMFSRIIIISLGFQAIVF